MRTRLTDDETAVKEVFDGFFANESPIAIVRAAEPQGHDSELWSKLAATGAPGMALPESVGGGGASLRDLAVVVESWGAHLAPVPLVEHAVATRFLHTCGSDIDSLVAGEQIATLALRDSVAGAARLVPAGAVADVVVARAGNDVVRLNEPGPGTGPRNTGDLPIADRELSSAETVGSADEWTRALDEWRALMSVAYCGLGRQALALGVDYVKDRIQFDVPVGTFQAIQHGLADAATKLEGAHLLAHRAVWALDTDQPDASRLAGMALLFGAETARFCTDRSLQYHGGYGFSEEYDIQLYHRRASAWLLQLGEPSLEYARLADDEIGPIGSSGEAA
ncbi:MAG: acyl-CoA dehydrogenase family protein [Acidimicrobiales bacterium]|jgi:alkylation response protein AidB-like acyl-CoA dehydrogenase|nr:acyl-CoA dehydrogenase family protein [Acidimicrobiales bacterium]